MKSGNNHITISFCVMLSLILMSSFSLQAQSWIQQGGDINGDAAQDVFGSAVSISADGLIMAIGAAGNDGNGSDAGHVRVYEWNGSAWIQKGADIEGEATEDWCGGSVSISANGLIVAIGAIGNDGNGQLSGHVRIFEWNGNAWTQKGTDIDGEADYDRSGGAVSINADGSIVAIGADQNNGNGSLRGHVRVFEWNGNAWMQKGADIDGEADYDLSGGALSINATGLIVAIGAITNDGNGSQSGHVRIFEWNGNAWIQKGADIDGEAVDDNSGGDVSINADGSIVAIGADQNDGNGTNAGHVRIFEWNGNAWVQKGADIDGEAASDQSGSPVRINADGSVVVIGAGSNDASTFNSNSGHARIYEWTGNAWVQKGADIDGEADSDYSGHYVSINADGSIVALGAPGNNDNGSLAGQVRVFSYSVVGIAESTLLHNIAIFPNPTEGIVTINFGSIHKKNVKVFSTTGKLIYQKDNVKGAFYQFELIAPAGIYFVEISTADKKQQYKLVKTK
jgi:hypothetical protein